VCLAGRVKLAAVASCLRRSGASQLKPRSVGRAAGRFTTLRSERHRRLVFQAGLDPSPLGCINRRMPRMQVYLPDDLYALVKEHRLAASELLQNAVRAEVRRLDLLAETDRYVADLTSQVGSPGPRESARAKVVAERIAKRVARKVG
jgi:hypothetical protein